MNGDGRPDLYVAELRRPERPGPGRSGRLPGQLPAVRDRLYLNLGPDAKGRSRFREVARAGRRRGGAGRPRPRCRLHRLQRRRTARSLRRERHRPEPSPRERPAPYRRRSGSGCVERARQRVVADPQAGMGVASADFNRDARPDLFVTNSHRQLHGVLRQPRARIHATPADLRAGVRHPLRRLGRGLVRPRPRRRPRRRARERGDPGPEPRPRRGARSGAREPSTGDRSSTSARACSARRACVSTGGGSQRRTTTTTATWTSRSTRSRGPLALLRNAGSRGHWLEVAFERVLAGRAGDASSSRRATPRARGPGREQLPLVGGPAPALRPRPRPRR